MLDFSLLSFQKAPPIDGWRKRLHLAAEIRDILPSEYALPLPIRRAALRVSDWVPPVHVMSPDGRHFAIHDHVSFLKYSGVNAQEAAMTKAPFPSGCVHIVRHNIASAHFFVIDRVPQLNQAVFPLKPCVCPCLQEWRAEFIGLRRSFASYQRAALAAGAMQSTPVTRLTSRPPMTATS